MQGTRICEHPQSSHTANSPILSISITNERLKQAGYIFFMDHYRQVDVNLGTAVYRTVRAVVCKDETGINPVSPILF